MKNEGILEGFNKFLALLLEEHTDQNQKYSSDNEEDGAIEKVEDMPEIISYGVMSTPGVVIDGQVVHAGGVPSRSKVESWF